MSRMRQVPVMDIQQQEKYLNQSDASSKNMPAGTASCNNCPGNYPCNPNYPYHYNRNRRQVNLVPKFRLSEAPDMISNGCNSLREFCNNIQSITIDLNNLLSSIESMLPLLSTYLAAIQTKPNLMADEEKREKRPSSIDVYPTQEQMQAAVPTPQPAKNPPIPGPEDIQQLLENPLVKNILTNFMQNNQRPTP